MVDNVSQATLKVNVEGEGEVASLNAALAALDKSSKRVGRSAADIRTIGTSAVSKAATREARQQAERITAASVPGRILAMQAAKRAAAQAAEVTAGAAKGIAKGAAAQTANLTADAAKQLASSSPALRRSLVGALGRAFAGIGNTVAGGLRAALSAARSFGSTIGPVIGRGLVGVARITVQSIGTLGRGVATVGLGIARVGAGFIRMTGILALVTGGIAGMVSVGVLAAASIKSLTFAMSSAKQEAEDAFKTFSRARRLRSDWGKAEDLEAVGKILFRGASEQVEDSINRMREKVRLGRSEEGDKQVFGRLGITAKTLARFEKEIGKAEGGGPRSATAVDFAERFVKRLETQQAKIDKMAPGKGRDAAMGRQRQFFLDLEKVFGDDFADAVARSSSEGIKKAFQTQAVAGGIGPEQDSKERLKRAQDLILAQASLDRSWSELKSRIAVDVQPTVTALITSFTNLIQAIGPNIADKISDLAKRGLGSLKEQLDQLDAVQIETWGKTLFDTASKVGESLPSIVDSLNTFVGALKTIADAIKAVTSFLGGSNPPDGKKPVSVTEDPYKWFRNTLEKGLQNSTRAPSREVQAQIPDLNFSLEEGAQRIRDASQAIIDAGEHARRRIEEADFSQSASAAGAAMAAAFRTGIAGITIAPPSWLGQLRVSMPGGGPGPQKVTAFPPSTGRDTP